MTESKREKFVRLAEMRTNRIIHMLRILGNCSNQNLYEYTAEDVEKIFDAIQSAVASTKKRYAEQAPASKEAFSLK